MDTILARVVDGCRIDQNSMYEQDLAAPVKLGRLYSEAKGFHMYKREKVEIPRYLGQDYDIREDFLYKYLHNK